MRKRRLSLALMLLVIAVGLPTRLAPDMLPTFMVEYAGDALWALAIFLGFGFILPTSRTRTLFLLSLVVTWGIEFSELYQADWINAIRRTLLGGLILGYTFLPLDLLLYLIGIGAGVVLEKFLLLKKEGIS